MREVTGRYLLRVLGWLLINVLAWGWWIRRYWL